MVRFTQFVKEIVIVESLFGAELEYRGLMWWEPETQADAVANEGMYPLGNLYREERFKPLIHGYGTLRLSTGRVPLLIVDSGWDERFDQMRRLLRRNPAAWYLFKVMHARIGAAVFPRDLFAFGKKKRTLLGTTADALMLAECALGLTFPTVATLRQFVPFREASESLRSHLRGEFIPPETHILFSTPMQPTLVSNLPRRIIAFSEAPGRANPLIESRAHVGAAFSLDEQEACYSTVAHLLPAVPTQVAERSHRFLGLGEKTREVGTAFWRSDPASGFDVALVNPRGRVVAGKARAVVTANEGEMLECNISRDGKLARLGVCMGALQRIRAHHAEHEWKNCFVVSAVNPVIARGDSGACVVSNQGGLLGHLVGGGGYQDGRGRYQLAFVQDASSTIQHMQAIGLAVTAVDAKWVNT